ncbi:MAG TPA: phosphohistidine phosphatase SixA [Acidobacteriota bacterium]|nr:phosphohistidine phosphatase SixA [Acidobacteriota bacterium]
MRLYIVRHAIAAPHGTPGLPEDDRPLTEDGIKKMRQAAAGLRSLDYVPELIMSSPLPRALQTAEILIDTFGLKRARLEILEALAPAGSREELYLAIASHEKKLESLMLVGHQPSLGEIAGEIIWGAAEHSLDLKKGGACLIELEHLGVPPSGNLVSLLTPSILRKLSV